MIEMGRCGRRVTRRAERFLCWCFWVRKQQFVVGRRERMRWMSRLEVVEQRVGLGRSGAWVGVLLVCFVFSKGPTLGRH